jgi:hypothetical protein
MEKTHTVIVSRCFYHPNKPYEETVYGMALSETTSMGEEYALRFADPFRIPGLSVTVRPNFNDEGLKFHEFRSFNGGAFKRVDWLYRQ